MALAHRLLLPFMAVLSAVAKVVVRALLALSLALVVLVCSMLAGLFGGSGHTGLALASFLAFFGIGWSLYPLYRHSQALALVVVATWLALGASVVIFGYGKPWPWASHLALWLGASGALVGIERNHPKWFFSNLQGRGPDVNRRTEIEPS